MDRRSSGGESVIVITSTTIATIIVIEQFPRTATKMERIVLDDGRRNISSGTSVWISTTLHISEIFHPESDTNLLHHHHHHCSYYLPTTRGRLAFIGTRGRPRVMSGNWIRSNCECIMKKTTMVVGWSPMILDTFILITDSYDISWS